MTCVRTAGNSQRHSECSGGEGSGEDSEGKFGDVLTAAVDLVLLVQHLYLEGTWDPPLSRGPP